MAPSGQREPWAQDHHPPQQRAKWAFGIDLRAESPEHVPKRLLRSMGLQHSIHASRGLYVHHKPLCAMWGRAVICGSYMIESAYELEKEVARPSAP